jgi:hypothetical protein
MIGPYPPPVPATLGSGCSERHPHLAGGDYADRPGSPVPHFDRAVRQSLADHDRGRNADELGVLELHPGRNAGPVVVKKRVDRRSGPDSGMTLNVRASPADLVTPKRQTLAMLAKRV